MKQIPINEDKLSTYNKNAVKIILLSIVCGIITGLILSVVFVNEANYRIEHFNEEFRKPWPQNYNSDIQPLTTSEIILPSFGVVIVCISMYLLISLIIIYIKIFLNTNSKYIVGLLFFLTPLLIQSIILINALRSLFVSSSIPFRNIRESVGFGLGGLGGIIILISIFEIIGLSILLYLSSE
jgi:hypothetical protein